MNIVVNGEPTQATDGESILALVQRLGLGGGPVAVEQNGEVVPRKRHATTLLAEGDRIEIVHFVGGG